MGWFAIPNMTTLWQVCASDRIRSTLISCKNQIIIALFIFPIFGGEAGLPKSWWSDIGFQNSQRYVFHIKYIKFPEVYEMFCRSHGFPVDCLDLVPLPLPCLFFKGQLPRAAAHRDLRADRTSSCACGRPCQGGREVQGEAVDLLGRSTFPVVSGGIWWYILPK